MRKEQARIVAQACVCPEATRCKLFMSPVRVLEEALCRLEVGPY